MNVIANLKNKYSYANTSVKKIIVIVILLVLSISFTFIPSHAKEKRVYIVSIKGMIAGGTEYEFEKALKEARDGEVLIVSLSTPGGMASSMDNIIEAIENSKVPVVIYVAPAGAEAFSAGTYILMSSDIAAMAPSTTIGACQPRIINPATGFPQEAPQKEINAYTAKMKSLALSHGRNATIAEKFVTENLALTEKEALENGIIEIIASNITQLVGKLNGMTVKNNTLNLTGAKILKIQPSMRGKIINYLSDPQIASLLLTIGLFGLIIGFFTPTFHLPETIGAILIILALYGLSYIGINAAGILLIALGIIFMVVEALTPTFGFWTVAAVITLIFGIMLLPASSAINEMPRSWYLSFRMVSIVIIIAIASFFIYALIKVAKAKKIKPRIGEGDLVGKKGVAITDIKPEGQVKVSGEIWKAESDEEIRKGDKIMVSEQKRLKLKVRKA